MSELLRNHVLAVSAVAALLAAATSLGGRLVGRWTADKAFLATAAPWVGFACMAMVSLALLVIGGLPVASHLVLPVLGLVLVGVDRRVLAASYSALWRELIGTRRVTGLAVLLMCAVIGPFALGPVVDWDSLTFHARVPLQLLQAGRIFVPPDNLHVAQLGIAHLASVPLLVLGLSSGQALLSLIAALGMIPAAALLGIRLGGRVAGRFAAAGVAGTPLLYMVAMTPRVDAFLAVALLVSMLGLVSDSLDRAPDRAPLVLVLLGVAAGTKFHGIAFAAILFPWLLWLARIRIDWVMFRAAAWAALFCLPWLVINAVQLGSPVFPFFAPPTLEPWLAEVIGTSTWPPTIDAGFRDELAAAREPFSLIAFLFAPGTVSVEVEGIWYRPSLLLLALPLVGLAAYRRAIAPLLIAAFAYGVLVLSFNETTNLRYLLPAVGPLLVLSGVGVAAGLDRLTGKGSTPLQVAVMVIALWPAVPLAREWLTPSVRGHALGMVSATEYWIGHPDPTVNLLAGIPELTNHEVGESGKLLMLFDGRGGAFRGSVIADTRASNWPILAQTSLAQTCLDGTGITHVILNVGALDYYVRRGASGDALQVPSLARFTQRCLSPVFERNGFMLFKVNQIPPGQTNGERNS